MRGDSRSEEGEEAVAVSYIRRRLSVAAVKGLCLSFLGRLEVLGPVTAAAAVRRRWAQVWEHRWRKDSLAMLISDRICCTFYVCKMFNLKSYYESFISENVPRIRLHSSSCLP